MESYFYWIPGWGWDFDELIEFLHLTISQVNKDVPVVLVTHDWGAFLGLLYQTKYPQNVEKLILFDVGMLDVFTVTLKSMLYITMYQVWLALSFIVSRIAGVFAGTIFMAIFFLPIFRPLWPTTDAPPIKREEIRSDKCYPYFHLWKKLLTTLKVPKVKFPTMPTLYMYGTKKNVMFHDQHFLQKLNSRADCRTKSFEAGHWLQIQKAKEVVEEMKIFLAQK